MPKIHKSRLLKPRLARCVSINIVRFALQKVDRALLPASHTPSSADAARTEHGAAKRSPPMAETVVWACHATDALSRRSGEALAQLIPHAARHIS